MDKYFGRGLDQNGLVSALRQAVHKQVIPSIVDQLEKVRSVLNKLDSYRFYAASLLIIYEGSSLDGSRARVYLIDFAQSFLRGFEESKISVVGTDEDFIEGVTHLVEAFKGIYNET